MKRAALIATLFALSSCGADGPPLQPEESSTVTLGTRGASPSFSALVQSGPVSAGVAF